MAPQLVLLLGLLAFSMAHAQIPTPFTLTTLNRLIENDAECTIAAPELLDVGGTGDTSFFVEAESNRTVPLQASQSLSSPSFRVELFDSEPLGRGCYNCCAPDFGCPGKLYIATGNFLQRLESLANYEIDIVRNCGNESQPKLFLEGYTTSSLTRVKVDETCVSQDLRY